MTQSPRSKQTLQAVLVSGFVFGLLAGIPVLSCCCCLWHPFSGLAAVIWTGKQRKTRMDAGEAIFLGFAAGAVAGLVSGIGWVFTPMDFQTEGNFDTIARQAGVTTEMMEKTLPSLGKVFAFFIALGFGSFGGAFGGLIGASFTKDQGPPGGPYGGDPYGGGPYGGAPNPYGVGPQGSPYGGNGGFGTSNLGGPNTSGFGANDAPGVYVPPDRASLPPVPPVAREVEPAKPAFGASPVSSNGPQEDPYAAWKKDENSNS